MSLRVMDQSQIPFPHPVLERRWQLDLGAYSLSRGMELRLLVFCTMLAWLRREMRMQEAASLQGSPSTCMGMALDVVRTTCRH